MSKRSFNAMENQESKEQDNVNSKRQRCASCHGMNRAISLFQETLSAEGERTFAHAQAKIRYQLTQEGICVTCYKLLPCTDCNENPGLSILKMLGFTMKEMELICPGQQRMDEFVQFLSALSYLFQWHCLHAGILNNRRRLACIIAIQFATRCLEDPTIMNVDPTLILYLYRLLFFVPIHLKDSWRGRTVFSTMYCGAEPLANLFIMNEVPRTRRQILNEVILNTGYNSWYWNNNPKLLKQVCSSYDDATLFRVMDAYITRQNNAMAASIFGTLLNFSNHDGSGLDLLGMRDMKHQNVLEHLNNFSCKNEHQKSRKQALLQKIQPAYDSITKYRSSFAFYFIQVLDMYKILPRDLYCCIGDYVTPRFVELMNTKQIPNYNEQNHMMKFQKAVGSVVERTWNFASSLLKGDIHIPKMNLYYF